MLSSVFVACYLHNLTSWCNPCIYCATYCTNKKNRWANKWNKWNDICMRYKCKQMKQMLQVFPPIHRAYTYADIWIFKYTCVHTCKLWYITSGTPFKYLNIQICIPKWHWGNLPPAHVDKGFTFFTQIFTCTFSSPHLFSIWWRI